MPVRAKMENLDLLIWMLTLNGLSCDFVVAAGKKISATENKASVFSYCWLIFPDTMGAPTFAFLPTEKV